MFLSKFSNYIILIVSFLIIIQCQRIFSKEYLKNENFQYLNEYSFDDPNLPNDRNLIVHLFEWKWSDIEMECKNYLNKHGFGAVQISPPTEHIFNPIDINGKKDSPWYHRYQPVSYKLESRSGTQVEFISMVNGCNKAGIGIIVDVVLNHMASVTFSYDGKNRSSIPRSTGGSAFYGHEMEEQFPAIGYTSKHFHDIKCNSDISNYSNRYNIQFCRLLSLADLDQSNKQVQDIIVKFLNRLIDIGVLGFRFDASKHMRAEDLAQILPRLKNLNSTYFGEGKQPFIYHEIIDHGDSVITISEYLKLGRVKNFNYHRKVTDAIRNGRASDLLKIREGNGYGNLIAHEMLNFLDNHDNQRYETSTLITHKNEREYRLAAAFMLSTTYGAIRLMSSFNFITNEDGPPNYGPPDFNTKSPEFNDLLIGGCKNGWICEQRWPEIRRMAEFRRDANGSAMGLISLRNGANSNCFGFARLDRGYFAMNNERNDECILEQVDTSLADGLYCNIYAQDFTNNNNGTCETKNQIIIKDGKVSLKIPPFYVIAFNVKSKIGGEAASESSNISILSNSNNDTVIFIQKHVEIGQHVFLRGGIAEAGDCEMKANKFNKCAIPIRHVIGFDTSKPSMVYENYRQWSQHDNFLEFLGAEHSQGTVDGEPAQGTPMIYTNSDRQSLTYHPLNEKYKLGNDFWMVILNFNCSKNGGNFSIKGYVGGEGWETGQNHLAKCGKINIFKWGSNQSLIF